MGDPAEGDTAECSTTMMSQGCMDESHGVLHLHTIYESLVHRDLTGWGPTIKILSLATSAGLLIVTLGL
jgi:hypothetical protein